MEIWKTKHILQLKNWEKDESWQLLFNDTSQSDTASSNSFTLPIIWEKSKLSPIKHILFYSSP